MDQNLDRKYLVLKVSNPTVLQRHSELRPHESESKSETGVDVWMRISSNSILMRIKFGMFAMIGYTPTFDRSQGHIMQKWLRKPSAVKLQKETLM